MSKFASSFDHSHASRRHWWIVIIAGLVTLICGTIGGVQFEMAHHPDAPLSPSAFFGATYTALQMLILHTPHFEAHANVCLEIGRWMGAFTLCFTTWFLLWDWLRHEYRLFKMFLWSEHCVVCGLGHKGVAIVESIKQRNPSARVVVIDPDPAPAFIDRCHHVGVGIIRLDATDPCALRHAYVARAAEIMVVALEDETNMRIATAICEFRREKKAHHGFCRIHISSSHFLTALQQWANANVDRHTTLSFFDVFDDEARRILLNIPREEPAKSDSPIAPPPQEASAPLDGTGITAADARSVHVIVLGMGHMGGGIVLRGAKMGQFANGQPLRISVIDREARLRGEELFFRYPILAGPNDICALELHQWEADSLDTRRFIEQAAENTNTILHVFICLDSNARALEIGLRLREILVAHPAAYVSVRIRSRASLAPILQTAGSRIQAFGMLEDTCTEGISRTERNEALARSIHEAYVNDHKHEAGRDDDPALAAWARLRDDFRESNRQQADHMAIKMRAIGCRIVDAKADGQAVEKFDAKEIEMLSELEHRRWNAERYLSGWKYGKESDKARRINKNLVTWSELSDEIRDYDRATIRRIPGWLAAAKPAMKVVRT